VSDRGSPPGLTVVAACPPATAVRDNLIAAASGDRITLRTAARAAAMTVLANAGATVAATGPDTLTVAGLTAERVVSALNQSGVAFSEVTAHRATLEEAYMELTRDEVEFRAVAGAAEPSGHTEVAR
jgi:ABC-2 type transport system ATP-binding protein